MYSLYKAWLLGGDADSHVAVTVGSGGQSRRFTGHRHLLAEHSGYFKSLIDSGEEIRLPNLSPEVFAPLLAFMYTGYLELTPENVYGVLLGGHLLHMPRAVDLCRGFLLRQRPALVKPRPCRPVPAYPGPAYPPPPPPPPDPPRPEPPPAVPSTSAGPRPPSPASDSSGDGAVTVTDPPIRTRPKDRSKAVTDVACCDGPVRFRRVLNANYGPSRGDQEKRDPEKRPLFACHYCKHTFKSHYCYRKHTRRHINPVAAAAAELDLNVQYYPCKTCGSKFPSYYFVHKHRKMCHPDEAPGQAPSASTPPRTPTSNH